MRREAVESPNDAEMERVWLPQWCFRQRSAFIRSEVSACVFCGASRPNRRTTPNCLPLWAAGRRALNIQAVQNLFERRSPRETSFPFAKKRLPHTENCHMWYLTASGPYQGLPHVVPHCDAICAPGARPDRGCSRYVNTPGGPLAYSNYLEAI